MSCLYLVVVNEDDGELVMDIRQSCRPLMLLYPFFLALVDARYPKKLVHIGHAVFRLHIQQIRHLLRQLLMMTTMFKINSQIGRPMPKWTSCCTSITASAASVYSGKHQSLLTIHSRSNSVNADDNTNTAPNFAVKGREKI
jgi:hypothetical protein